MKTKRLFSHVVALSLLSAAAFSLSAQEQSQKEWHYQTDGAIWSAVRVQQDIAYFGSDDGHLYALDLTDRALEWRFDTDARVRSHAAFFQDSVLFSSDDGYLYAVDRIEGELRWKSALNDGEFERVLPANHAPWEFDYGKSSPVVDGRRVFVGSADGYLYAFNVRNGKLKWRYKTEGPIRSTPVVHGRLVIVGSKDGSIYAFNKRSGRLVWQHQTNGAVVSTPIVADGKVVVGSRDTNLYALNVKTGEVLWQYASPVQSWVESSAVTDAAQNYLYIGSSDARQLLKLNINDGSVLWQFNTGGWSWGQPLVHQDNVYVGAKSTDDYWQLPYRGFYSVSAHSGEMQWQYQPARSEQGYVTGGVFGQPAVYQNQLLVPDLDGSLQIFTLRHQTP